MLHYTKEKDILQIKIDKVNTIAGFEILNNFILVKPTNYYTIQAETLIQSKFSCKLALISINENNLNI